MLACDTFVSVSILVLVDQSLGEFNAIIYHVAISMFQSLF